MIPALVAVAACVPLALAVVGLALGRKHLPERPRSARVALVVVGLGVPVAFAAFGLVLAAILWALGQGTPR